MAYLTSLADRGLEIPRDLTPEAIEAEERARLAKLRAMALYALTIPRRVEGEDEELATDKKRCRRVAFVAQKSNQAWGGDGLPTELEETDRISAAQLDWPAWCRHTVEELLLRRRFIATWGLATDNEPQAKKFCVRLTNEIGWLQYALRT